jgi:hypothetical protein
MISKKTSYYPNFIAYHTGPFTHLDHLGVLCIELGIPMITSDSTAYNFAKEVYPELEIHLIEEQDALSFLAAHCDVLLGCGKYWASQLKEELLLFFGKSIRMVFCPHGNSDKGRTYSPNDPHPSQDIVLFYGQQMHDLWNKTGLLNQTSSWLFSGNYRYAHYLKQKEYYDSLAAPLFAKFSPNRKTIFYAPTWPDKENPTPVLQAIFPLIENLGSDFQLLLKLHPLLIEKYPHLQEQFTDLPFVQIASNFAPIYPLLAKSNAYLGDFSSIGYDALAFDLPLYFLVDDLSSLQSSELAKTGRCFPTKSIPELYHWIRKSLNEDKIKYKEERKKLYTYAFGEEREPNIILKELREFVSPS